jgi:hypothetical protein
MGKSIRSLRVPHSQCLPLLFASLFCPPRALVIHCGNKVQGRQCHTAFFAVFNQASHHRKEARPQKY